MTSAAVQKAQHTCYNIFGETNRTGREVDPGMGMCVEGGAWAACIATVRSTAYGRGRNLQPASQDRKFSITLSSTAAK